VIRRRAIALTLPFGSVMTPLLHAQTSRPKLIVLLGVTSAEGGGNLVTDVLRKAMSDVGWVDGRDVVFDGRYALGDIQRLPEAARQAVALSPSVIWMIYTPAAVAARRETSTIPIVGVLADPIGSGLAQSLAHPGGNVTGVSPLTVEGTVKMLDLLRQAQPRMRRVAVFSNANNSGVAAMVHALRLAAEPASIEVVSLMVRSTTDLEPAFARIDAERVDGVIFPVDYLFVSRAKEIGALLKARQLPAAVGGVDVVTSGALLSYGQNFNAQMRQIASFIDRILKGARPGELPFEQPTKLDLRINLRVARTLGLTIPESLRLLADEVIE
jgi:ABC-type uncharacterized transport system substrate-binding protein